MNLEIGLFRFSHGISKMNLVSQFFLKSLHHLFCDFFVPPRDSTKGCITNPDVASQKIYDLLVSDKPCLVCRYGSVELNCVANYLSIKQGGIPVWSYITNKRFQWWWNEKGLCEMQSNAGFFPLENELISNFCELMLDASKEIDILGHWLDQEELLKKYWPKTMEKITLLMLEPYWSNHPWSAALEGKRVVVVHPFASLIEKQYKENRKKLFRNPNVLPEFDLRTIKAVQSIGGNCDAFENWFEALDWMKKELDKEPYDVALIGCGAYGMPLAAYAKKTGHKAIHLGGALQLFFGIRGKRWDNPNYGEMVFKQKSKYQELFNSYWVYPGVEDTPHNANFVENGCYW